MSTLFMNSKSRVFGRVAGSFWYKSRKRSVCDGGHEGVLGLRDVQSGALRHDGAVRLHENGVGLVAGNGLALVIDLLIQADVVGVLSFFRVQVSLYSGQL